MYKDPRICIVLQFTNYNSGKSSSSTPRLQAAFFIHKFLYNSVRQHKLINKQKLQFKTIP